MDQRHLDGDIYGQRQAKSIHSQQSKKMWADIKATSERQKVISAYGDKKKSAKEKLQDTLSGSSNGFFNSKKSTGPLRAEEGGFNESRPYSKK